MVTSSDQSSPARELSPPTKQQVLKRRECDIIMKGGITSGVVYPKLAVELGKFYDYRGIGGASAGAIAATATAAAQYYRNTYPREGREYEEKETLAAYSAFGSDGQPWNSGFRILDGIPDDLANDSAGSTKLFKLFQPTLWGAPAFRAFAAFTQPGWSKVLAILSLLFYLWPATLLFAFYYILRTNDAPLQEVLDSYTTGILQVVQQPLLVLEWLRSFPGVALAALSAFEYRDLNQWRLMVGSLAQFVVDWVLPFLVIYLLYLVIMLVVAMNRSGFGLCTGMGKGPSGGRPLAVTEWLHDSFQRIAGRNYDDSPLTFGELRSQHIDLALISTNLAHGQPYAFPYNGPVEFFYDPVELLKYFPKNVVNYLNSKSTSNSAQFKSRQLQRLPTGDELPVIIATRMSMAFPVVLSAIPLYAKWPKPEASLVGSQDVVVRGYKRCWFSDGGITTNLPVHFFDGPIPSRPTFIVNLASPQRVEAENEGYPIQLAPGPTGPGDSTSDGSSDKEALILLTERIWKNREEALKINPDTAQDRNVRLSFGDRLWYLFDEVKPIGRVMGFGGAIWNAARIWNDHAQITVPGYGERTFNIVIAKGLGGLNLKMTKDQINKLGDLGLSVAADIILEYRLPPEENWHFHQWVRLKSTTSLLGKYIEDLIEKTYSEGTLYRGWLSGEEVGSELQYPWTPNQLRKYQEVIASMRSLVRITRPDWSAPADEQSQSGTSVSSQTGGFYGNEPTPEPAIRIRPKL